MAPRCCALTPGVHHGRHLFTTNIAALRRGNGNNHDVRRRAYEIGRAALGADRPRHPTQGLRSIRHDRDLRRDCPIRRPGLGRPAGRRLGLRLLDPRLRHVPHSGRHRHRPARPDVPRRGFDLRLDEQSARLLLGLLRGLLRLVARHARHGGDRRAGREPAPVLPDATALQRRQSAGRPLAAGDHHPGGHLVLIRAFDPPLPGHAKPGQRRLRDLRRRHPDRWPRRPRLVAGRPSGGQRLLAQCVRPQLRQRHLLWPGDPRSARDRGALEHGGRNP